MEAFREGRSFKQVRDEASARWLSRYRDAHARRKLNESDVYRRQYQTVIIVSSSTRRAWAYVVGGSDERNENSPSLWKRVGITNFYFLLLDYQREFAIPIRHFSIFPFISDTQTVSCETIPEIIFYLKDNERNGFIFEKKVQWIYHSQPWTLQKFSRDILLLYSISVKKHCHRCIGIVLSCNR